MASNCQSTIVLKYDRTADMLVVTTCDWKHQHPTDPALVGCYTQNRKLSQGASRFTDVLKITKPNIRLLQRQLYLHGNFVTTKDLHNLRARYVFHRLYRTSGLISTIMKMGQPVLLCHALAGIRGLWAEWKVLHHLFLWSRMAKYLLFLLHLLNYFHEQGVIGNWIHCCHGNIMSTLIIRYPFIG